MPKQLCIADTKSKPIPFKELAKLAKADDRNLSDYCRLVLINHVKEQKK